MSSTTNLTLYVAGASYYSVRVEVALAEKGINYDRCTINGFICENLEPWYMKMNPTGKVPTLMHGDKPVCGSAAILKYLDDEFPETVSLYPDKQSPLYDQIKQFEELVDSYFLGTLVGGCYKYPKYVPKFGLWDHNCCKNIWMVGHKIIPSRAAENARKHPELTELYERKKDNIVEYDPTEEVFKDVLEKVKNIVDTAEEKFQDRADKGEKVEYFMTDNFSSADIYLVVFLKKVGAIGFSSYWEDGKHPFVTEYFKRLKQRPSVKEVFKVYDADIQKISEFQIKGLFAGKL
ncbi:ganglioside-induced differentiation-associated protein 1-like [Saccoglossus kowalevskii]|uniref:Ganglioside-induced differentiation-associated protein 1-like n=1 Tax=Saccoglossus kowalevskii TaxID=10224 RepID=A0ABM0GPW3_SACKO|nr:PREDICTED: ganglioside-induced differentiation-associated protein 1-like [Saccoglossus kowalevskii]